MEKRSISIKGHRTSIAIEPEFWTVLEKIVQTTGSTLPALIGEIDRNRMTKTPAPGLASALRVHALESLKGKSDQQTP